MAQNKNSRIPNFHKLTTEQRIKDTGTWSNLTNQELQTLLTSAGINLQQASNMIENPIGIFGIPLGIATNFSINNQNYLIPMAIEEPSVIAAASNAAKLFREGGGIHTSSDEPIMIGQIQLTAIKNLDKAIETITHHKKELLDEANTTTRSITRYGGGAKDILTRAIKTTQGPMLVIHLLIDTHDAMGANAVNTAVEHIAPLIENLTGGEANLRILSNLADQRKARAEGTIPAKALANNNLSGDEVIDAIISASIFAESDPYRAATHNKGIMNGIDAVVLATGNDWRAVEAGAHAYAARGGSYTSLTKWQRTENGDLHGSIELPMAVGIVGGTTQVHSTAQIALKILGVQSARELAEVIAAVGLAQNFAAIRALATEGIQKGHMRMHARQLAAAAGAPDDLVTQIAQQMINEKNIRLERAKQLVQELQKGN